MIAAAQTSTRSLALGSWLLSGCLLACACSGDSAGAPGSAGAGGSKAAGGAGSDAAAMGGRAAGAGTTGTAGTGAGRTGAMAGRAAVSGTGGAAGSGGAMAGADAGSSGTGAAPAMSRPVSVLQYHNHASRDGLYIDAAFTRDAAAKIKKDPSFKAMMTGDTYAQPLYFEAGQGGKDLLITATEQNEVTAFDAAGGAVVWRKVVAPPAQNATSPCGNINPLGITGTPVIDAQSRTLYLDAITTGPKNQVFALSLDDGSVRQGFPVDIDNVKGSATFNSSIHNQRGALLLLDKMLYVPFGGRAGDCGDYNGWVVGVPLDNPSALISFATQAHGAGMWSPGGLASDGTSIFAATGNSKADGGNGTSSPPNWGHGEAILRLPKDLKTITQSQTKDFFAAENWAALDRADLDIGGSGPVLFSAPGSSPSDFVIALGKDGAAYLLDRANLGGMGGMLQRLMLTSGGRGGAIIQAAAAYTAPAGTFVVLRSSGAMGCGMGSGALAAIKVSGAKPSMSVAWCAGATGNTSPMVTSTDGTNETIVWYVAGGKLLGFNGETGAPVYAGGADSDSVGTTTKFQTAIAAKGRIFMAAGSTLHAFTLK